MIHIVDVPTSHSTWFKTFGTEVQPGGKPHPTSRAAMVGGRAVRVVSMRTLLQTAQRVQASGGQSAQLQRARQGEKTLPSFHMPLCASSSPDEIDKTCGFLARVGASLPVSFLKQKGQIHGQICLWRFNGLDVTSHREQPSNPEGLDVLEEFPHRLERLRQGITEMPAWFQNSKPVLQFDRQLKATGRTASCEAGQIVLFAKSS